MFLCLGSLIVGIVIGGSIEAAIRHNRIHLIVMPYGEINVSPETGDVIDWVPYDQSKTLAIKFSHNQPCDLTSNNVCTIQPSIGPGVFLYSCAGSASCPDPGVGPASTTNPGGRTGKFPGMFDSLMLGIDHLFGFNQTQSHGENVAHSEGSGGALGSISVSASPQAMQALSARAPVEVYCDNHTTKAPPVSGKLGETIYWASDQPFTLTMSASICKESTSSPGVVQQCTLTNATPGASYTYTALELSCSAQASTPQNVTVQ